MPRAGVPRRAGPSMPADPMKSTVANQRARGSGDGDALGEGAGGRVQTRVMETMTLPAESSAVDTGRSSWGSPFLRCGFFEDRREGMGGEDVAGALLGLLPLWGEA